MILRSLRFRQRLRRQSRQSCIECMSERLGFVTRASRANCGEANRAAKFDTRLTVRVTQKDKVRFEEIAYRLRLQTERHFSDF